MSLRDRKREVTRERIVAVASRLFDEHGYDETTVEAIAEASDVSPRTFYRYFETKDGVLAESGHRVVEDAIERAGAGAPIGELARLMAEALERSIAEDHVAVVVRLLREHPRLAERSPLWHLRWASHLSAGLAERAGRVEATLSERVRAAGAVTVVSLAVDEWLYRRPDASIVDLVVEATEEFAGTLAATPEPA